MSNTYTEMQAMLFHFVSKINVYRTGNETKVGWSAIMGLGTRLAEWVMASESCTD